MQNNAMRGYARNEGLSWVCCGGGWSGCRGGTRGGSGGARGGSGRFFGAGGGFGRWRGQASTSKYERSLDEHAKSKYTGCYLSIYLPIYLSVYIVDSRYKGHKKLQLVSKFSCGSLPVPLDHGGSLGSLGFAACAAFAACSTISGRIFTMCGI